MNLIIPLNNPICPQIVFNIKQKDISELMNEIYNIINENHQNEINRLKEKVNELEEKKKKNYMKYY